MENFGLPEPDHKLGEAHPTISVRPAAAHRPRAHQPQAQHRAAGGRLSVHFVDGTDEPIDTIVYCTGYRITLPVPRPTN